MGGQAEEKPVNICLQMSPNDYRQRLYERLFLEGACGKFCYSSPPSPAKSSAAHPTWGIYGLALCGSYGWRLMGAYEGIDQHAHVQNDPGCPEDLGIKIECDAQTQGDKSDKEGQKQNHPQFLLPYEIRKLLGNPE